MSRSKRKTPIFGITTAPSDKEFKRSANRAKRRAVSQGEEVHEKKYGNPYASSKDGKRYWTKAKEKDMRK